MCFRWSCCPTFLSDEIRAAFGDTSTVPKTSSIISESPSDKIIPTLTQREQEILTLITVGKSNQEIVEMLYIAPGTVRVHIRAILQKLDVRDRTKAAAIAIQRKLIAENLLTEPKDL